MYVVIIKTLQYGGGKKKVSSEGKLDIIFKGKDMENMWHVDVQD